MRSVVPSKFLYVALRTRRRTLKAAAAIALAPLVTSAAAQAPAPQTIRFVVPFTPGSGTDIVARAVAEAMSKSMGQTIIVENRPGAGGTIAAAAVARSEADGNTVLIPSSGHALNPAIYSNLGYDTLKDLAGVTPLAALANVLVVNPARGWKTVADLVSAAKAAPGKFNYASAGNGSATHLNAEKFRMQAGISAVHVAFKGTPEALTEIIAGRLDWFFAPMVSALPMINDNRLLPLAVSTAKRSASLPQIPTTLEAGIAGSDYTFWVGMIVPAKTPRAIVSRLHEEALKAMASSEVIERLGKAGAEPFTMSSDAFDAFIKSELETTSKIAIAANLKI